ncbi:MAG: type II secretion system F family protein [Planctomycetales bacterium]|nr:type II secretion system F family protein [Planctomycetales bacterium]
MPIYQYKGLVPGGGPTTGLLDAASPKEAREKLRAKQVYVTEIGVASEASGEKVERARAGWRAALRRRKVSASDLAMITRQLATLLQSGVPLAEALGALIEQIGDRRTEGVFRDLRERVTQGASFGDALEQHPEVFSDLYVNMIRAGEASGNLDEVLLRLSDYSLKQSRLRNKVMTALTYPMIMCVVGAIVVIVLMKFAVPNILKILQHVKKKDAALPVTTQLLMTISNFVERWWVLILLSVVAMIVALRLAAWTERGRYALDKFLLKLPIFGLLFRKQAVSRFAVTMSTLLKSGIPVLEALQIVQRIVGNSVIARTLAEVRERIIEGADISTPLKKSGVFPPVVGYMVAIGEESGRLEEILTKIAESYDEEVELATQRLTALLEPVIILLLAGVVAFIALSVIQPVLELGTSVR